MKRELTERQKIVYKMMLDGYSNKEIAKELEVSYLTIKSYVDIIKEKIDIPPRKVIRKLADTQYLYCLSDREREVYLLACEGLEMKEISKRLWLSFHTVKAHLINSYRKIKEEKMRLKAA